jgi:hypothetical protein
MTKELFYKGKTFESLDGFLHEIAVDLDLDEAQLAASAEAYKQAGLSTKQLTNPEVLASIVTHVDEQQYAVNPQDLDDICSGLSPEDCEQRRCSSKRARSESDQDIIRFEEEDLHDILNAYARMKGR